MRSRAAYPLTATSHTQHACWIIRSAKRFRRTRPTDASQRTRPRPCVWTHTHSTMHKRTPHTLRGHSSARGAHLHSPKNKSQIIAKELKQGRPGIGHTEVIALVDDDPSVRKSVSRLLESDGFSVRAFSEPEAFLKHLATNS